MVRFASVRMGLTGELESLKDTRIHSEPDNISSFLGK
jgi:hypothetical protein